MVSEGLVTIPESACCWGCGYSLRGLGENRCPECGRGFDPSRHLSYCRTLARRGWVLVLFRPPHLITTYIQAIWAIGVMIASSVPGGNFAAVGPLLWSGFALAVFYVIRAMIAFVMFLLFLPLERGGNRRARRWAAFPMIVVVTATLLLGRVPLYVRFLVSLPSLNDVVARSNTQPAAVWSPRWVGLFPVDQVESGTHGVRLRIPGTGFLSGPYGFAYSRTPLSATGDGGTFWPLWGDWYVWSAGSFIGHEAGRNGLRSIG